MKNEGVHPGSAETSGARDARTPVTSLEELSGLDITEMVEGYNDGRAGFSEPGDNRSKAYWHGWRNGASDAGGAIDEAQRVLAAKVVAASKTRAALSHAEGRGQ